MQSVRSVQIFYKYTAHFAWLVFLQNFTKEKIDDMETAIKNIAMQNIETFLGALDKSLPLVFDRDMATKTLGGLIAKRTLANADAAGTGPAVRMKIGKKVIYEKTSFMEWLKSRIR